MNQSNNNFKADKISLIYEFDKTSPLFVRVAQTNLDNMEVDQAITILEKGLSHFPDYPSAYFIYGKALAIKGNIEKAKEMITVGSALIDSDQTLKYYMNEIAKISSEYANYNGSVAEDFVPHKFDADENMDNSFPNLDDLDKGTEFNNVDDLEKLAENISKAKMPKATGMVESHEESNYDFDERKIISETLAAIYVSQGNHEEALSLYRELLIQNPRKADLFNKKIVELEEVIKNKND